MNIKQLCEKFSLGQMTDDAESLQGGSLHDVWRITTDEQVYTLKKYNALNLELLEGRILPVEQSNRIAQVFGLDSTVVVDENEKYMIQSWVDGDCIYSIDEQKAYYIGELLRDVHSKSMQLELPLPRWGGVDLDAWANNISTACDKNLGWAKKYYDQLEFFSIISAQAERAQEYLLADTRISHRDISPGNVIWYKNESPKLIDWDFAGPINPELELFIVAVNFSYQQGHINRSIFDAITRGYGLRQFCVTEDVLGGYFGYGLDWLAFNIDRALISPEQHETAEKQLLVCLDILKVIYGNYCLKNT